MKTKKKADNSFVKELSAFSFSERGLVVFSLIHSDFFFVNLNIKKPISISVNILAIWENAVKASNIINPHSFKSYCHTLDALIPTFVPTEEVISAVVVKV